MRRLSLAIVVSLLLISVGLGCAPGPTAAPKPTVVLYCALDLDLAQPIIEQFERTAGVTVLVVADTEATKTTALVNRLLAERAAPQCDVFWNNEPIQTARLKAAKILAPYRSPAAADIPAEFRDPDSTWTGFAARARVLLINPDALAKRGLSTEPSSLGQLTNPAYRATFGVAKPLNGTSASHFAALAAWWGHARVQQFQQDLTRNAVAWESGNGPVARQVADGTYPVGLTDSDDAARLIAAGKRLKVVWPDQGDDEPGTLVLPNTVSLVAGAPHAEAGRKLIDFLLSREVEAALASGPGAQIPVRASVKRPDSVPVLNSPGFRVAPLDVARAADEFEAAMAWLKEQY